MGVKKQVEHDYAKVLYVNEGLTQKEIAERLNLTEKTVSKWANANDKEWDKQRVSMLTNKDNQLKSLYRSLENLMHEIDTRVVVRDIPAFLLKPIKVKNSAGDETLEYPKYKPEDYPIKIGNFPNSKDTDMIAKVSASIKRLETETNIGDTIQVVTQLIQFIRSIDVVFANDLTKYCDSFITDKMK